MAKNEYASARLRELKGSDYEVADGQPDIRGWDVKDSNGKTIGEVDDLIFDEQSLKVRYMVVDMDDNDFDLDDDKDVLIPIGLGEIPKKDDMVIVPNATKERLVALPDYKKDDGITSELEYKTRNVFEGGAFVGAVAPVDDTFYNHEYFNEDNLNRRRSPMYDETADTNAVTGTNTGTGTYDTDKPTARNNDKNQANTTIPVIEEKVEIGKQQVKTGGAYIKARIVETPVEETVNLKEEHLNIDRKQVDRPANSTDFDTFKEGVIEMEERAEVPVVNKQARVVEEINVNKEVTEHTETVRDTVRKTEVDVENLGDKSGNYKKND